MRARTRVSIFIRTAGALLSLLALPAAAQSYTVLHGFTTAAGGPVDLLKGADGALYVPVAHGGAYNSGSILRVVSGVPTLPFYTFHGPDGSSPNGGLVQDPGDSSFYGTTNWGGTLGQGTVFKIDAAGTLVWSYSFGGPGGLYPAGGLLLDNGVLYGTTSGGGNNYQGTVFRITTAGTSPQFFPFDGSGAQGRAPASTLVKIGSTLYGTTQYGGANGSGTVFAIPTGGGAPAAICSFAAPSPVDGTNAGGANPVGPLVADAGGHLYGTANLGGANALGAVFKIDLSSPASPVWVRSFTASDGSGPSGLIDGHDGLLYGLTGTTLFRVDPSSDTLTTLASLSSASSGPPHGLLKDGSNFFGTSIAGGPNGTGSVFQLDSAYALTNLYSFPIYADQDGAMPLGDLVWDATNTWLYGTTANGGQHGHGTVFRVNPTDGTFETIYAFTGGSDGASPQSALVLAAGNFYGTTVVGGTGGSGTVFRIPPCPGPPPCAPALTPLHSFIGSDGFGALGALAYRTADGFLYGTTASGGAFSKGTVFKIKASDGTGFQTLYSFSGLSDGQGPRDGVLYGGGTTFFGTAVLGGANSNGTVFALDTSTTPATLMWIHSFTPLTGIARTNLDGVNPYGGLVDGGDGYVYGTTSSGGHYGMGAVFKIRKTDGTLGNSHGFLNQGQGPQARLVRGPSGLFYGTTASGGPYQGGTIFRWDSSNADQDDLSALTSLHAFDWYGGRTPRAGLVPDSLGTTFYGVASTGGPGGSGGGVGVVFSLTLDPAPAPTVSSVFPASGPDSGGTPVTITGSNFQPGATVTFGGIAANPSTTITLDAGTIMAVTPADPGATSVDVVVTNHPDMLSGSLPLGYTYVRACAPLPPPIASNGGPYCLGNTIALSAATVAGASYSWTGPAAFASSAQNPAIPNASAAMAGNYTVTITAAGCTYTGTTTVSVNSCPGTPTPVITTLPFAGAGSPNRRASVALHPGSVYFWDVTGNGTMDPAGQGMNEITFTAGAPGTVNLSVVEFDPAYGSTASLPATATVEVLPAGSAIQFYIVTPCRIVDTRRAVTGDGLGGPNLMPGQSRKFTPTLSTCGIPDTAKALLVNVTVALPGSTGDIVVWGDGVPMPSTPLMALRPGLTRALMATIVKFGDSFWIHNESAGTTPVIVDASGYFE
jgi:uncharacterized repeat protein (TIGR03803 family)